MGSKGKLSGKVFVVTGAGNGMGRELTLELVRRGAQVAAVDIRERSLAETKSLVGGGVETFTLDITNASEVAELPERVLKVFGAIDGLINNAGVIQPFRRINQLEISDAERVLDVNFHGPFLMIKAFLPVLISRPEGAILNVSSMGAYAPVPGQSLYGASKAAIAQLSESLRSELMSTNVSVTTVYPGAINTKIAENSGIAISSSSASDSAIKTTDAKVAARMMIDAIEKKRQRIFIGSDARSMNFFSRFSPRLAAWLIYRNMRSLLGE